MPEQQRATTSASRSRRAAVVAAGAVAVLLVAAPARAQDGSRTITTRFPAGTSGYIAWTANCNPDGSGNYAPSWDALMTEYGNSKVKRLKVEYLTYKEGTGADTVRYSGTSYVKDLSFGTYKASTANNASSETYDAPLKATSSRGQTSDIVLVMKFNFGRGAFREDSDVKQVVEHCGLGDRRGKPKGGSGSIGSGSGSSGSGGAPSPQPVESAPNPA